MSSVISAVLLWGCLARRSASRLSLPLMFPGGFGEYLQAMLVRLLQDAILIEGMEPL
ncbi:hypothetical protein [Alcaligenes sp. Marseille-Q7550]